MRRPSWSVYSRMGEHDGPTEPALKDGDLVEVANDAIGVLANRVRKEA